ncbi:MAG: lipoprotein-releasing ABC transporter permease subunit [Candidatus Magnetoovum sp. WYHC-5]|nr:lipoprotein-releasing ABC transporter permease subunit [Candidatus Magnetoovum sp. WYHC-5]
MKLPYSFFIALRYLKSRKKHKAISFTTLISMVGVMVGVMALIIVLSVMSGFHEDLQKKILGVSTHVLVFSYEGKMKSYMDTAKTIKNIDGIKATSPFILGQVMISNNKNAQGAFLRGIIPENEAATTDLSRFIKSGSFKILSESSNGIVIGKELANNMGLRTGDEINIISPIGEIGPLGLIPKAKKFQIVAIFEIGMYEYDTSLVITSLKGAQDFFGVGDVATGIEVKLDDIYKAPQLRDEIAKTLGGVYYARDWMQMNKNLFAALNLEKLTMFIILTLIVIVASFNIISTLTMNVMEKEREIAILRTMGANSTGILTVFMFQGLLIGLIGTTVGATIGVVISYVIDNYQIIKLPGDVYYLTYLPAKVKLNDFALVCISAVAISFLSTIYPSYRATKINPVEPLRFE